MVNCLIIMFLEQERRQRCNTCSAPPAWKMEAGDNNNMPHGPEASYGIPFRWSASRLLAADMRAMVCGSRHNQSTECNRLLNLPEWTSSKFAQRYMTGTMPALLSEELRAFAEGGASSVGEGIRNYTRSTLEQDEDYFLWSGQQWVACNQLNNTCYGSISKSQWYNRATRGATCNDVFKQQVLPLHVYASRGDQRGDV